MAVPDSQLLTIHVADLPDVTRRVRALMARVESQEARIDALTAENERLSAQLEGSSAADQAATFAHSLLNRSG